MLEKEDLIENKYYHCNGRYYREAGFIFKFKNLINNFINTNGILRDNLSNFDLKGLNDMNHDNLREATPKEIIWLETCIKENRYVPFEDIKFNNELKIKIW